MLDVTFVDAAGISKTVQASLGTTLMQTAVARGIHGIVGECGGNLLCATCHVYVDEAWLSRLLPPTPEEDELLEDTTSPRQSNSRLSCQIVLDDSVEGIIVTVPATQA